MLKSGPALSSLAWQYICGSAPDVAFAISLWHPSGRIGSRYSCVLADWEGRLRNRGLTEDELHSAGWGCPSSRTVPQPNQPFKWAELPSAEPAPEPEESPSAVNAIVEGLASEQTTLMALARDNDSVPRTSMMFSAAKAHEVD